MDLSADLAAILRQHLKKVGLSFPKNADTRELLFLVTNYELKTVKPLPRRVHISAKFKNQLASLPANQQKASAAIQAKFQHGQDVNDHLSTKSNKPKETDALLAEWGIHHLHISNQKKKPSDTFYERSGPVMFVLIKPTDVYFIDIYPHGPAFPEAFSRQDVLAVIEQSWSHLFDHARTGALGAAQTPTDLQIRDLRGNPKRKLPSTNSILQVGKSVVAPPGGGGLTIGGGAITNTIRTLKTVRTIQDLEKRVNRQMPQVAKQHGIPESALDFHLVQLENPTRWAAKDTKTQTIVE